MFVNLPAEDLDSKHMCARLLRHMCGTRMARMCSTLLVGLGFKQGASCPNLFYHEGKSVRCSVHGDDFTSVRPRSSLDWLEDAVAKSYEVSV